ncbi:hypothetical protein F2Q70_00014491, partial [Brassica cretica]
AIRQSRVAVVLLSRNYASSSWCLDELVEIMKCREERGEASMQAWRQALKDVAGIAGYHSSNCDNEADLINTVASDVTAVLGFTPSKDFDNFVGIELRIIDIKSKFILQSEQVKMIVLVDPAGLIFCQYAFGQKSPDYGFEMLAREVTGLAGDLPLGLRVMGSYLPGMSREEWIDALPRLKSSLDREIESTLRFSYDALNDKDKAHFLHIACFFSCSNCTVDSVKSCLEKSGLEVNHGLQVLADKSLISIDNNRYVKMHSLLQKMGREIVKKRSSEEPGKRQFLWDNKEISDVLEENTGTETVLGIWLFTSNEIQTSKSAFDGMNNLQFLKVYSASLCIPEGLNCPFENLAFQVLWQPLQCLKRMDLSASEYLKKIPDLSKATSLEELDLSGCKSLLELTSSIGNATKLRICKLKGCLLLKELPSSISRLINLEGLNLSNCGNYGSLKEISGCSSLEKPKLSYTPIEEVSSLMITWSCLYRLDIKGCTNIKEFPNVPDSIVELSLSRTWIEEIPPWIEKLFRLRKLIMHGCEKLKYISPNFSMLENLEDLYGYEDLSTFEDYFRLNQDFPEAEETTFSNLLFQFKVLYKKWRMKVKGCGVQLLEVLQCSIDGKESEDEESMGIMKLKENNLGRDDDVERTRKHRL